jgi:hypothetical protein
MFGKLLAIILIVFTSGVLRAQLALRTYASILYENIHPRGTPGGPHWYFFYDDDGQLDSLIVQSYNRREYSGLAKLKPFVMEFPQPSELPPNQWDIARTLGGEDEYLKLTEPEVGKIRILKYEIKYDSTGRSVRFWDTIRYDYDPHSGRLLRYEARNYTYENDDKGRIRKLTVLSSGRVESVWRFRRSSEGRIIALEQFVTRFGRDSLIPRAMWQVLKWQDSISGSSVLPERRLEYSRDDLPYLPEGIPAVWIRYLLLGDEWRRGSLYERVFDEKNRLIYEESDDRRTLRYHETGVVAHDRKVRYLPDYEWDRGSLRVRGANGLIWSDITFEAGNSSSGIDDATIRCRYEHSYRYPDTLWGDRLASKLWYRVSNDTVTLTIDQDLPTDGLTAYLIDTTEKEVEQIQLTGRKTIYILPKRDEKMYYAIRWKYKGRKIVDQAF